MLGLYPIPVIFELALPILLQHDERRRNELSSKTCIYINLNCQQVAAVSMQMAACEAINYWIIRGGGSQEMSCPDTQGFCPVE